MSEKYIFGSKNNGNKILRNGGKILGYNIPKTAFAIYSADDNSLIFYYGIIPEEGHSYKGKTVTNVYTGFETETWSSTSSIPWYSLRTSIKTVSIDRSFKNVQPVSLAYWFCGMTNATFDGLENIDTSLVTTLRYTFWSCSSLTNVDGLSGWDTSNVTTLYETFYICNSLTNVDGLSGWNTSNVTTLYYTFYICSNLANVDGLSGWDVSNVTTLSNTFYNCSNLANVDGLSGWNTSNVTTLQYTFRGCSKLTNIDINNWNTAKVTDMRYMFYGCSLLETIYSDDSNFVTSKVTSGSDMFTNCSNLVGGNGTKYSSSNDSYTMAHVDTADNPGYFTAK